MSRGNKSAINLYYDRYQFLLKYSLRAFMIFLSNYDVNFFNVSPYGALYSSLIASLTISSQISFLSLLRSFRAGNLDRTLSILLSLRQVNKVFKGSAISAGSYFYFSYFLPPFLASVGAFYWNSAFFFFNITLSSSINTVLFGLRTIPSIKLS